MRAVCPASFQARLSEADRQLAEARAALAREQQGGAAASARVSALEAQLQQLGQAKVGAGASGG